MQNWFHVNPHSGIPIYLQLKEQIKTAVAGGVLPPGAQLPSVRELALSLAVNPNTIARAYSELEHEGLLVAEQGKGTFISHGEPTLEEPERLERIKSRIDQLLVEAFSLKLSVKQLEAAWTERLEAWRERLSPGAGKDDGDE